MGFLSRADKIRRRKGSIHLLKRSVPFLYNRFIWPRLPRTTRIELNGVPVGGVDRSRGRISDPDVVCWHRLFDSVISWETPSNCTDPEYEEPLLAALREHVSTGDDVVIVGGGRGVSGVVAAQRVGPDGSVRVYEGGEKRIEIMKKTFEINDKFEKCNIIHSIVGSEVNLVGDSGAASVTDAGDLPECDVLELDCEGAELEILRGLSIRPRVIIVETHGFLDSSVEDVHAELRRLGYRVVDRVPEVQSRGVYILTGVRSDLLYVEPLF